jgi:ribosomal protein S18 acetylase RimI-like enzyme
MNIRAVASAEDINLAKNIAESSFSDTPDASLEVWFSFEEMSRAIEEERGMGLMAIENDNGIGMIYAQQENPINGMEGLEKWVIVIAAVKQGSTGKGVGAKLLEVLETRVQDRGAVKMFVYTNKDDDKVINFYKKNGYVDAGFIKDYQYGEGNSAVFLLKYLHQT